jgi:hypothetical protein
MTRDTLDHRTLLEHEADATRAHLVQALGALDRRCLALVDSGKRVARMAPIAMLGALVVGAASAVGVAYVAYRLATARRPVLDKPRPLRDAIGAAVGALLLAGVRAAASGRGRLQLREGPLVRALPPRSHA